MEDVSGSATVDNASERYGKRWQRSEDAYFIIPEQAFFPERHPAKPAAPALEIIQHRSGLIAHLLAQTFGYDRHVDEAKEFVRIRASPPPSSEVKIPASRHSLA